MGSLFSRKKPEPAKTQTQSVTEDLASGQLESEPKVTAVPPSGPRVSNDIAFIDEDADDDSPKVTQEIQNPEDNVQIAEEQQQEEERKEKSIHTVTFNLPEKKDESASPVQIDDIKCEVSVATENVAQVPKSSGDSDIEISTELPVESEPSQIPSVIEGFNVTMSHSPAEPEILKDYQNDIETLEHSGEDKVQSKVETHITLERPPSIVIPEAEKVVEISSPSPKFETKVEMVLQPSTPTQEEVITLQQDASNEVLSQVHNAQVDEHLPEKPLEISETKNFEQTDIKEKHSENVKVTIKFTWEQGGSEVFVGGSFTNWEDLIAMELSDNKHEAKVELSHGTHYYKFFVDGNWTVNENQPVVEIPEKGQVNQIEVKA